MQNKNSKHPPITLSAHNCNNERKKSQSSSLVSMGAEINPLNEQKWGFLLQYFRLWVRSEQMVRSIGTFPVWVPTCRLLCGGAGALAEFLSPYSVTLERPHNRKSVGVLNQVRKYEIWIKMFAIISIWYQSSDNS